MRRLNSLNNRPVAKEACPKLKKEILNRQDAKNAKTLNKRPQNCEYLRFQVRVQQAKTNVGQGTEAPCSSTKTIVKDI